MSDPRDPPTPHAGLRPGHTHCANCGTELMGPYCHVCGQSTKHVLKHVPALAADAVDAIFNVDARITRTLPALFFRPGFLAREYFAGRRMRYVPPFRLMFFMSVLAFLLAQVWVLADQKSIAPATVGGEDTAVQVHADIREALARIDAARADPALPAVGQLALALAAHAVPKRANQRLRELDAAPVPTASVPAAPSTAAIASALAAIASAPTADAVNARADALRQSIATSAHQIGDADALARVWLNDLKDSVDDASDQGLDRLRGALATPTSAPMPPATPIALPVMAPDDSERGGRVRLFRVPAGWLPAIIATRINDGLRQAEINLNAMSHGSAQSRAQAQRHVARSILSTLSPALFVLMPVMALLLQIVYIFKRRLYIEHLIVTFYSHAFIFMALALFMLTALLRGALPAWGDTLTNWLFSGLGIWLAVYLFVMQKRVYAQGWFLTLVKYALVGFFYLLLLLVAVIAAGFIGLAR